MYRRSYPILMGSPVIVHPARDFVHTCCTGPIRQVLFMPFLFLLAIFCFLLPLPEAFVSTAVPFLPPHAVSTPRDRPQGGEENPSKVCWVSFVSSFSRVLLAFRNLSTTPRISYYAMPKLFTLNVHTCSVFAIPAPLLVMLSELHRLFGMHEIAGKH